MTTTEPQVRPDATEAEQRAIADRLVARLEAMGTAYGDLLANRDDWLVNETIGFYKRTVKRLDTTSRSLFALIEPGSCFAGLFVELALACDRSYMAALPDEPEREPRLTLSEANFGLYPMITGQSRLGRRFYDEAPAMDAVRAQIP